MHFIKPIEIMFLRDTKLWPLLLPFQLSGPETKRMAPALNHRGRDRKTSGRLNQMACLPVLILKGGREHQHTVDQAILTRFKMELCHTNITIHIGKLKIAFKVF